MSPEGLPGVYPHIQHVPCPTRPLPAMRSMRTVQTDLSPPKQTLQCPDCGQVWERADSEDRELANGCSLSRLA